jgi:glycerophosphoryl diester phosphodiesterase
MTHLAVRPDDTHFATLNTAIPSQEDHALALRHAPRIRFDDREPFLPCVVGYTVFRQESRSPSFPREVRFPAGVACAIEYAVWWDWDIGHLYELEHIWVYLDAGENLIAGEASWHGGYHRMTDHDSRPPVEDGRLTVHSEPGKHAFAPSPAWLLDRAAKTRGSCLPHAGKMGVHVTPLFQGIIKDRTPLNNQLVHTYLERLAFEPSYDFSKVVDLDTVTHIPWPQLFDWISGRVHWWTQQLAASIPRHKRRVLRIAHRGASAYAQEGSRSSIHKAVELGTDMIEMDIRTTADNVPVIAHDPDLKRVFGVDGLVSQMTLDELHAVTPTGHEPLLTFEEMAELCKSLSLGLYLDIKDVSEDSARAVLDSLERHSLMNVTIWGSFRPDVLAEIKAAEPRAVTSILFSSTHVDPVLLARSVGCTYVHPCWERFDRPHRFLTEAWIKAVHDAGLGIICWHEERLEEIAALQALGVNGICSDQPELLVPSPVTGSP